MLKLLKWDFINFIRKYYRIYIGMALAFVLTGLLPDHIRFLSAFSDGICLIYSLLFFAWTLVVSFRLTVEWTTEGSALLEFSLSVKPWRLMLSKLVLSLTVNFTGILLSQQLWKLIDHFGISGVTLFKDAASLLMYLVVMWMLIELFAFSYLLARSLGPASRKVPKTVNVAAAGIVMALLCVCLFGVACLFFYGTGLVNVSFDFGEGIFLSVNPNRSVLVQILSVAGLAAILAAGFFGSCKLIERQPEI